MLSLRSLAVLTAALSATAAANTVTIINSCSYDVGMHIKLSTESDYTTDSIAAGATYPATSYSTGIDFGVYPSSENGLNNLDLAVLRADPGDGTTRTYYQVTDTTGASTIGTDFTLTTTDSACPGFTGTQTDLSGADDGGESCTPEPDFTWTLCG